MAATSSPAPAIAPTAVLERLTAAHDAISLFKARQSTEDHVERAYEEAMRESESAKLHLIEAAKRAAFVLSASARGAFLADIAEATGVVVELEAPAERPRLVIPESPKPLSTKDKPPLPRKIITSDDDPSLPEFLRPPFRPGRPPNTARAVYIWLRRNPRGQSIMEIAERLDMNIRQVGSSVRWLEGKAVLGYVNKAPSKFETKSHGRSGNGPLRVRQYYCVA